MTDPKTDVWMPLWIGSYLADTMKLTTIQHGAYLLLLMSYWRERAPLIDSDDELRSITKTDKSEWKRLRPVLEKFFKVADGVWWHKRVEQEMVAADARAKKASEKAEKAAQARWGVKPKDATGNASSIPQALPKDKHDECPPPSPIPSSLRSEREQRASRLPADWILPDEWRVWAIAERPELDPDRTAEKFADYWRGVGGAKGRKLDWLATWRNWVREERAAPRANPQASEPTWRTEQRERTQQAAPGVAVKNPKDFFFDSEA